MGRNLAWNLHGQSISIATYTVSETEKREVLGVTPELIVADNLEQLVAGLAKPRVVFLMVTAGDPVDQVLEQILPLLSEGDVVCDGGNSHYQDTERRAEACAALGIAYLGTGVSGGEEGARNGASVMVGGEQSAFVTAEGLFAALSCEVRGETCYGWMGRGGAGHFVKTVHNGIEYGFMQLLAEAYDYLRRGQGCSPQEVEAWFAGLKESDLDSYLVDITCAILKTRDDRTEGLLLDQISDQAAQKGTGRWCVDASLDYGVPVPTIAQAVMARQLSNVPARGQLMTRMGSDPSVDVDRASRDDLRDCLLASVLMAFAQGLALIEAASSENGWHSDVKAALRLWRGGCIIRTRLLDVMLEALAEDAAGQQHLLLCGRIQEMVNTSLPAWRRVIASATAAGLAMPAMAASLHYFESLITPILPTNLIQAQRDYFGAHTFRRRDQEGDFHAQWLPLK